MKDVDNGKELAVNTFKTKASAEILSIQYNTSETYNVKVTSPEFTVKAKSVFEGASLVYYKAGASVDAIVNTETDMIAPLTGAAEKRNGLALKLGDSEMAVNFANCLLIMLLLIRITMNGKTWSEVYSNKTR